MLVFLSLLTSIDRRRVEKDLFLEESARKKDNWHRE